VARASLRSTIVWSAVWMLVSLASAQDTSMSGMQMQMQMEDHGTAQLPSPHAGSGTGWEPASCRSTSGC